MDIRVAGIVILYNPDMVVKSNIDSYAEYFDYLLLVDNSARNNEKLFTSMISENVVYIPLMSNKGIAYAMNIGFKKILQKSIPYVVTMDQDSMFGTNIIESYIKYIIDYGMDDIVALTPQYKTDRSMITKKSGHKTVKITMQSGSLFRTDIIERIGLFNNDLFLDVVDWEFFVRGRKAGMKIIQCNDAILLHEPAITEEIKILGKTIMYGTAAPVRYYYQVRNLLWAAWRYKYPYFIFVLFVKWVKIILLFKNKREYIKYANRAIIDVFQNKFGSYVK